MLPDTLLQNLHAVHDAAEVWLARLPETLAGLEARWQLRVTSLAPGLSFNLVAYAERADGTRCVLKLSPPFEEAVGEAEALSYYAGDGICRILERDDAVSALLLGRITPGLPSQKVWTPGVDEIDTRVTAELMQRLWRKVAEPHPLRSLQSWARALSEDRGPSVPTPFRGRAQALLMDLGPDSDPVLLHTDLHHGNILSATSEPYLAIDPKGVVGARGYDVGTYLLSPMQTGTNELIALLLRRLALFSELLGLSERELAA